MITYLSVEEIARICHAANRELQIIQDVPSIPTAPKWEDAPEGMKASTMTGVRAIIENPSITPEALHQKWCDSKTADGWKQGPVKDEVKKEHPCLVSYWDLPTEQRYKDYLFQGIVLALGVDTRQKEQSPFFAQCCYLDADPPYGIPCHQPAEYMVQFDNSPDGTTLSCIDHVAHLGGKDTCTFWPLTDEEKVRYAPGVQGVAVHGA